MFIINSNIVKLHGAAESLQGGRPDNQDDLGFADTPLGFLFIVCDGMGGGPGGKTASYIAKYVIANTLSECSPQMPREKAFKMAVSKANEALEEKMEQMPNLRGMGSTFVAVLINSESAMVAYAGDSRCYRMHGRHVLFRTKDHSLVGELVRKKALTEEQARTSPQSNVISRGLGSVSNHVPDIYEIPYLKGDRFILCTDGVWGTMPQKQLVKRFSMKAVCQQVVGKLSLEIDNIGKTKGGHYDNHTIAIIEMAQNSTKKDKWLLWGIGSIAALAFVMLLVIALWLFKKNDSITASVKMSENLYPTETTTTTRLTEKTKKADTTNTLVDLDSLTKVHNDSLSKTDSIKSSEIKGGKDIRKGGEQSSTKDVEVTTQKVINRLDSMVSYRGKSVEETVHKIDFYLNQVKSLLDELQNSNISSQHKTEVSVILNDVKKKSTTKLLLSVGKHKGMYEMLPKAKNKVIELREQVTQIKKRNK